MVFSVRGDLVVSLSDAENVLWVAPAPTIPRCYLGEPTPESDDGRSGGMDNVRAAVPPGVHRRHGQVPASDSFQAADHHAVDLFENTMALNGGDRTARLYNAWMTREQFQTSLTAG